MTTTTRLVFVNALALVAACSRGSHPRQAEPATSQAARMASISSAPIANPPLAQPLQPTRLLSLPLSAYSVGLGLDGDFAYLLTRNAAYRLAVGKAAQKIDLDLGIGPVLADSGIVFWSKGAVWTASKDGASVWRVATAAKQPEYFVASGSGFAWLDRADNGHFRILSPSGNKARVLVDDPGEISSVTMLHDWVFFVLRAKNNVWRIGRVQVAGGEPEYTGFKSGPTPATLTGTEAVIYYDMQSSEIRQLSMDLKSEYVWLKDFVCSPIGEAVNIYCARVEGFFEVLAESHTTKFLWYGAHETITLIRANAKQVVWAVDTGPDKMAVDRLPVQ